MFAIENTIKDIVSNLNPSSGDDLVGMGFDICNSFEPNLKVLSQDMTKNPGCMFNVMLEVTQEEEQLNNILFSLDKFWSNVKYSYFEACSIEIYKEKTILRFVTVINDDSFYVTGKVIVSGKKYQSLAAKYNPDLPSNGCQ